MAFVGALVTASSAQYGPDIPVLNKPLSVNVNLVSVPFTVTDKKGKTIGNLKSDDFRIYEDGELQTIVGFQRESADLAMSVAVLIDSSYSVSMSVALEKDAAGDFFRQVLKPGRDRALIAAFNTDISLLQDFTSNPQLLADTVQHIRAEGGTRLIDAVHSIIERKLANEEARRIVLVISDGEDNLSRVSLTRAIETAQQYDVQIYAVRVESELEKLSMASLIPYLDPSRGASILKRLTEETGGATFAADRPKQFTAALRNIASEMKSRYTIQYQSKNSKPDGQYRRIHIDVANAQYRVRCRDGYFSSRPHIVHTGSGG
jgi:Ca-activated chloride channel family protein